MLRLFALATVVLAAAAWLAGLDRSPAQTVDWLVDLNRRVADDVKMTVLIPNASEAARHQLPGGGSRVKLVWEPEHMHLTSESTEDASAAEAEGMSTENQQEGAAA